MKLGVAVTTTGRVGIKIDLEMANQKKQYQHLQKQSQQSHSFPFVVDTFIYSTNDNRVFESGFAFQTDGS